MIRVISFDVDGTLVSSRFVDLVWMEVVPALYAEECGLEFEAAKDYVVGEYMKVGDERMEWYDLKYWLDRFHLKATVSELLEDNADELEVYPEVNEVLDTLFGRFRLVITSNAPRDFLNVELDNISDRFDGIFSATTDFSEVKKSSIVYGELCRMMGARPFEVLHIGDSYRYDYEVPIEVGLNALFLDRSGESGGIEAVADLKEACEHIQNYA